MKFRDQKSQILDVYSKIEDPAQRASVLNEYAIILQLYKHLTEKEEEEMEASKSTLKYLKTKIKAGRFDQVKIDTEEGVRTAAQQRYEIKRF